MSISIPEEKITDALIDAYMKHRQGPEGDLIWQEHFQELADILTKHGIVSEPNKWVEITDDPETWPPEKVAVLVWDTLEIRIAFYDKDEWSAPLKPYLMRNQKIGWNGRRKLKNQRVYMWRPI